MPRTLEEEILSIMTPEGAVTMQEVYLLSKSHDYNVVKGTLLWLINLKYAELDRSVEPNMYFLTSAGEEYVKNQYASRL